MTTNDRPPFPREHGAWVVLGTCWLFGIFLSDAVDPLPAALLLVAAVAGFTLTEPVRLLFAERRSRRTSPLRRRRLIAWSASLAATAVASALPLALLRPQILWAFPPALALFALYLGMRSRRAPMADLSIVGFLALSLVAPLALAAADAGASLASLVALWIVTALFFCASALCVRVRLVGRPGARAAGLSHAALVVTTAALWAAGAVPALLAVAALAAALRCGWSLADIERYRAQSLKRIGLVETGLALVLAVAGALSSSLSLESSNHISHRTGAPMELFKPVPNFDHPIEALYICHANILARMDQIDTLATQLLDEGTPVFDAQIPIWEEIVSFFRHTIANHTRDEEEGLFPMLGERAGAIVERMEFDHRWVMQTEELMISRFEALKSGEHPIGNTAVRELAMMAREVTRHYREHIRQENEELFPKAAEVLSDGEKARLGELMRKHRKIEITMPTPVDGRVIA